MHKIKREIGIVMLARARYAHGEFLAIFVKSVKTLKSHATAKILKMVKSTGLLAEAEISQKWSKFSRLQNPTLRLCLQAGAWRLSQEPNEQCV